MPKSCLSAAPTKKVLHCDWKYDQAALNEVCGANSIDGETPCPFMNWIAGSLVWTLFFLLLVLLGGEGALLVTLVNDLGSVATPIAMARVASTVNLFLK